MRQHSLKDAGVDQSIPTNFFWGFGEKPDNVAGCQTTFKRVCKQHKFDPGRICGCCYLAVVGTGTMNVHRGGCYHGALSFTDAS